MLWWLVSGFVCGILVLYYRYKAEIIFCPNNGKFLTFVGAYKYEPIGSKIFATYYTAFILFGFTVLGPISWIILVLSFLIVLALRRV